MSITITQERPDTPDARQLIAELSAELELLYPPEERFGYSVDRLVEERVPFFVMRDQVTPVGCGALKLVEGEYAEIERMYVRPAFRGLGLSKLIVNRLAEYAQSQGIDVLRLETGIYQPAAIGLYERMGFRLRPPFGEYRESPIHKFYEKQLGERSTR
jgi:GNAT superfamily N-acetyltransferase